jgi:gp16 family phage-associated protein
MTSPAKQVNPKYRKIRAALINSGHTVSSWARANGYKPSTVFDAAKGLRHGVIATRIKRKLEEYTNA